MSVSVLIPARNEPYLARTIQDVLENARGEVEVIPVLDGYTPELPKDSRIRPIYHKDPHGMRPSINAAAAAAKGDFLLKLDAHCSMAPGYDVELTRVMEPDWLVTPVRRALDPVTWTMSDPTISAHYLTYPLADSNPKRQALRGREWRERAIARKDVPLDEDCSFQGSCWMVSRQLWDKLGGLSCEGYGQFVSEPQELGNKVWLSGGRVLINRRTHYGHWRKSSGQGYARSARGDRDGTHYCVKFWLNNEWKDRVRDLEWLIDRFKMPSWPPNWREHWDAAYKAGWPNVPVSV